MDLQVTNNGVNGASFRRRLNAISKNMRNKNSIELLFKDVKHFDAENPVICSLIKEVDVVKKKDLSKFLDKATNIRDLEIQSRLNKLSEKNEFFNRRDNNIFFLPNAPPPPLGPSPPALPSDLFNIPNILKTNEFLNNNDFNFDFSHGYVPPAPDPLPLRGFAGNFFPNRPSTAKILSNMGINTTQTISSDRLIGELERAYFKTGTGTPKKGTPKTRTPKTRTPITRTPY